MGSECMHYEQKDKRKKRHRERDLGPPGVCFPNQALWSSNPCFDALCVSTFEIFSAFLAWVMEESTFFWVGNHGIPLAELEKRNFRR